MRSIKWCRVVTYLMLQRGGLGLSEAVDIEDDDEVVELVVAREVQRLPHAALRRLAVAHQAVHPTDTQQHLLCQCHQPFASTFLPKFSRPPPRSTPYRHPTSPAMSYVTKPFIITRLYKFQQLFLFENAISRVVNYIGTYIV